MIDYKNMSLEELLPLEAENPNDGRLMHKIGLEYYNKLNDYETALKYFEKAVELGYYDAYTSLAYHYTTLNKEYTDMEKGVSYLRLGMEHDIDTSFFYMAYISFFKDYEFESKDITKIPYYLQRAIEKGNSKAKRFYAKYYLLNKKSKLYNLEEGTKLLLEIRKVGFDDTYSMLYSAYKDIDSNKALSYLIQGSEDNDRYAMQALVDHYENNNEIGKAIEIATKGAEQSLNMFVYYLVKLQMAPKNGKYFNMNKAYDAYKKLNFAGFKDVYNEMLALIAGTFNNEEVFNKIVRNATARQLNDLGISFTRGELCPENLNKKIQSMELAVEKDPKYKYPSKNLFYMYTNVNNPCFDIDKGVKYFNNYINADGLDGDDYESIVIIFHNGDHFIAKNQELEYKYAKEGIKFDVPLCYTCLGVLYKDGKVVDKDFDLALEYLEKASSMNDFNAYNMLGIIYKEGKDVAKDYNKAIEYLEKSVELNQNYDSPYTNLGSIYYDAFKKIISLNKSCNYEEEALKNYKKYFELVLDKKGLQVFDLHKGLLPFNDLDFKEEKSELDKYKIRNDFLNLLEQYKLDKSSPDYKFTEIAERLLKYKYSNIYLVLGRCYQKGLHYTCDLKKAEEYYIKSYNLNIKEASYELANICLENKNYELAYKYLIDAATNFKGKKYNYVVNDNLIKDLENEIVGYPKALVDLARLFEFDFGSSYYPKQKKNLEYANFFYQYAYKFEDKHAEINLLAFALRNKGLVKDSTIKRLLTRNAKNLYYAAYYEKCLELELNMEAELIFRNIINSRSFDLIDELKYVCKDEERLAIITSSLENAYKESKPKLSKVETIIASSLHPYTKEYESIVKEKEKKEKEEEKKRKEKEKKEKEEEAKRKKLLEEEKKKKIEEEKALKEKKAKEAKEKKEADIKNNFELIIKYLRGTEYDKALKLLERNNNELLYKYPYLEYMYKLFSKKFKMEPMHVKVTVDATRKMITKIHNALVSFYIDFKKGTSTNYFEHLRGINDRMNIKSLIPENMTSIFGKLHDAFKNVVDTTYSEEEKKFIAPLFSIMNPRLYPWTLTALIYKDEKIRKCIYSMGSFLGNSDARYNYYVVSYKELGIFKKKEKDEIISNMKLLANYYYPAYRWLEVKKVKQPPFKYIKNQYFYMNKGLIDYDGK